MSEPAPTPAVSDPTVLANMEWPCTDSELLVRLNLPTSYRIQVRQILEETGAPREGTNVGQSQYTVDYPTAVVVQDELGINLYGPQPPVVPPADADPADLGS